MREEGLDLLAAVQQLPTRTPASRGGARSAMLVVLAILGTHLSALPARAQQSEVPASRPALEQRVEALAGACDEEAPAQPEWRRTISSLSQAELQKLQRLVRDVEQGVYEDEDCGALDRLEQGLALAARTVELEKQQEDARAARARARDILARPEFQEPGPKAPEAETPKDDEAPPGAWQRLLRWLAELLEKLFRRDEEQPARSMPLSGASGQSVANVLVVVLIAGVLVVLALVLLRALGADKKAGEGQQLEVSTQDAATLAADPMNALSRPPEGWARLADELAARGEYREAVRGLYLALLSRLHREGVIHYDTTLSNWDYLRQFRSRREWLPSFRELTLRFDFAWYGNLPVGPDGYRDFRALCAPMLSTPSTAEAAGA